MTTGQWVTRGALLLLAAGCGGGTTGPVVPVVDRVSIAGAPGSLQVTQEVSLAASAYAGSTPLPGATFTWATSNPNIATVTPGGRVRGVAPGQVEIRATSGGVTQSVAIQVLAAPAIQLSQANVTFLATLGGTTPPTQAVIITNGGTGSLTGLALGSPSYLTGPGSNWLTTRQLSGTTADATLTLGVSTAGLAVGTYTASLPITSGATGVTNSPQAVTVTLTISQAPSITLSANNPTFTAAVGGANPATQNIQITNGGSGTLSGLAANGTITYSAGASGWITTRQLSATTAPATLTLGVSIAGLAAGTYTATFGVTSSASGVTNSPQTVTVTLTISQAPSMTLSANNPTFTATVGGANPATQNIQITNGGNGTLTGLAASGTITYSGGASGWLTTRQLSQTTAPATLTLGVSIAGLAAGTYTATFGVTSSASGVTNSPQTVTVTLGITNLCAVTGGALASVDATFSVSINSCVTNSLQEFTVSASTPAVYVGYTTVFTASTGGYLCIVRAGTSAGLCWVVSGNTSAPPYIFPAGTFELQYGRSPASTASVRIVNTAESLSGAGCRAFMLIATVAFSRALNSADACPLDVRYSHDYLLFIKPGQRVDFTLTPNANFGGVLNLNDGNTNENYGFASNATRGGQVAVSYTNSSPATIYARLTVTSSTFSPFHTGSYSLSVTISP